VHELEHDGYRLQIHVRDGRVKLYTMNAADWSKRYPRIVEEAARIKGHAIIDAEVVCSTARVLRSSACCIQYVEHADGHGERMFAAVCRLGLEGIVSKRSSAAYRSGPTRTWLKVKNPDAPASGGSGLSRPGGRPRVHGRHAAISAVAFAEPSGGNNDGDTEYETCGGKPVQDRVSSRAFLGLCHVVRLCWRPRQLRMKRSSLAPSSKGGLSNWLAR